MVVVICFCLTREGQGGESHLLAATFRSLNVHIAFPGMAYVLESDSFVLIHLAESHVGKNHQRGVGSSHLFLAPCEFS